VGGGGTDWLPANEANLDPLDLLKLFSKGLSLNYKKKTAQAVSEGDGEKRRVLPGIR